MENDKIYSRCELENSGIFNDPKNKNWKLTVNSFESVYNLRGEMFAGVSVFFHGCGNVILKNTSMKELFDKIDNKKTFYVYSNRHQKFFIYEDV